MKKFEWGLVFTAAFFLLLSALVDPMLTVGLAIVLLLGFSILRVVQSHNRQFR
jgi:hypothetical protein